MLPIEASNIKEYDNNNKSFPLDDWLSNYVTARPHTDLPIIKGHHAEELIAGKLPNLWKHIKKKSGASSSTPGCFLARIVRQTSFLRYNKQRSQQMYLFTYYILVYVGMKRWKKRILRTS